MISWWKDCANWAAFWCRGGRSWLRGGRPAHVWSKVGWGWQWWQWKVPCASGSVCSDAGEVEAEWGEADPLTFRVRHWDAGGGGEKSYAHQAVFTATWGGRSWVRGGRPAHIWSEALGMVVAAAAAKRPLHIGQCLQRHRGGRSWVRRRRPACV